MMIDFLLNAIVIGMASAVLSLTLTRNSMGAPFRRMAKKLGAAPAKLAQCYYCLGHWLAFGLALLSPQPPWSGWLAVDLAVLTLVAVTIATAATAFMLILIKSEHGFLIITDDEEA